MSGPSHADGDDTARKDGIHLRSPDDVAVAALLFMLRSSCSLFAGRADAQTGATVASQRGKNFSIYIKHFSLSSKDQKQRLTVGCPGVPGRWVAG